MSLLYLKPCAPVKGTPLKDHLTYRQSQNSYTHFFQLFFGINVFSRKLHLLRNQEKGVLAKGVSVESSVMAKETNNTQAYWPNSTFGTQSATAKRGVHFAKTPF